MTVTDPELTVCIRTAISNLSTTEGTQKVRAAGSYERARLQTIREVTESYAKIRLLDSQIEQLLKSVDSSTPKALSTELVLAQAELDSKRIQELAKLRESMCIVPRYALGQIPRPQLDSWIVLDVLDDKLIFVFQAVKPFSPYPGNRRYTSVKPMSAKEALDYIDRMLSDKKENLLRFEVMCDRANIKHADNIRAQLMDLVKRSSAEFHTDIRLSCDSSTDRDERHSLLAIGGRIGTGGYMDEEKVGSGGQPIERHILGGEISLDKLDSVFAEKCLSRPKQLPFTWFIEHDEESNKQVSQITARIREIAHNHNVSSLVRIRPYLTRKVWRTDRVRN